ncbi:MAG TPA: XdhC/CoxI family protein [Cytophagaceae bacterium]|jgi:xanthine/CO dehydrogenase XdhC/CoxF family maturation factor
MKELRAICEAYRSIDFNKRKAALATVVRVVGSAYRSPGARMLITDDGRWVGSISGGCLEGDALRKARQVMNEKRTMCVTYDTNDEDNKAFAVNMGCNGIIDVLLEPLDPEDDSNALVLYEKLLNLEQEAALATCFSEGHPSFGKKMLVKHNSIIHKGSDCTVLTERVKKDLFDLFETKKSRATTYIVDGEVVNVFVELIQPPINLILFGGGFDARPISVLAKNLGWSVTVTDECVAHIAPAFFPNADHISLCQRDYVEKEIRITGNTACVLMSHNYEYDFAVLKKLLSSEARYIGILGPRKRFDRMVEELDKQHVFLTAVDLERIHAPIGVDIGAEAPDEIAVSIIAEVMGKFSNRSGGFLKERKSPIHWRDTISNQVLKEAI